MCDFCSGKEALQLNHGTARVEDKKFLVVRDGERQFVYDLGFCPKCGQKLNYWQVERVFVSNITKDEIIIPDFMKNDKEYLKNPLHHLVCDKGWEKDKISERQVGFIIPEVLVNEIRELGYCDLNCFSGFFETY